MYCFHLSYNLLLVNQEFGNNTKRGEQRKKWTSWAQKELVPILMKYFHEGIGKMKFVFMSYTIYWQEVFQAVFQVKISSQIALIVPILQLVFVSMLMIRCSSACISKTRLEDTTILFIHNVSVFFGLTGFWRYSTEILLFWQIPSP